MCFSYNCGWKELQICSGRCVCCRYVGYRDTSSPALRPHRLPATSTVLLVLLESLRNHEKSMAESLGMLDRAWNSGCLPMNLFSLQRWFRAQKQHRTLVQQPGLMLRVLAWHRRDTGVQLDTSNCLCDNTESNPQRALYVRSQECKPQQATASTGCNGRSFEAPNLRSCNKL